MSIIRSNIALMLIILLGIVVRFIFLDRIPPAISGDELQYVLNAKAFFLSGFDLSGKVSVLSPLLFHYPAGILPQAELAYYLLLPFVLFPLEVLTVRLPFFLVGILFIPVMYLLGKKLGGKLVGLFAAIFTIFNPWLFLISHTAYESTIAMFFYFLGLLLLITLDGKKRLYALPIFLLAFYAYIGTKLVLVPFIIVGLVYSYTVSRNKKKELPWMLIIVGAVILISFIFFLFQQTGGRLGELLTPMAPQISEQVDDVRKFSIAYPFLALFENRVSIYVVVLFQKIADIFSTNYLFISGDGFFGVWRHGVFYFIDALLIIVGFGYVAKKLPKVFWLLVALLIVGVLPQIVHRQPGNFTPHNTLMFPVLILVAAFGAFWLWANISPFRYALPVKILGIGVYGVFVGYFLNIFFFQYPLQGAYDLSSRVLARYIRLAAMNGESITVFSHRPSDLYKKYLFYTDTVEKESLPDIQKAFRTNTYSIRNIAFEDCGDKQKKIGKGVIMTDVLCSNLITIKPESALINIKTDSEDYLLSHDSLCKDTKRWMAERVILADLSIEKLSSQRLCTVFFRQAR